MKKILFILLCILAGVQTMKAREPYVVFISNNKTMTFYYDNNLNSRPGRIYYVWLDPYNNVTSWSIESEKELFETVVFDDSFADARPRTTAGWFMDMKNLKNIEKIENLNTSRVEDMQYMFCNCSELRYLDLSSFNTAKAEDMKSMFRNCGKLSYIDLGSFNTENVKFMSEMFAGCVSLKGLDLRSFDLNSLKSPGGMFEGCSSLEKIYVSKDTWPEKGFARIALFDTAFDKVFEGCNNLVGEAGTTYDISRIDGSYAHIDGSPSNPGYLSTGGQRVYAVLTTDHKFTFYNDAKYEMRDGYAKYDLNKGWNVPDWYTDGNCKMVTSVVFDQSFKNVLPTTTFFWFASMSNLTSVSGLENLNTSAVANMRSMFKGCSSLTSLDLSTFNTSITKDMGYMFSGCSSLTDVNLSSFDTMFATDMGYMFDGCSSLKWLELDDFFTKNVIDMTGMFQDCTSLVTISVGNGWSTESVTSSLIMFQNCTSLVGGEGTPYSVAHTDGTYAHIDGGRLNPGYLTYGSPTAYNLWVGGAQVMSYNKENIPVSTGSATYDSESKSLYLNNCTVTGSGTFDDATMGFGAGIYSNIPGLKVYVYGNVTVNRSPYSENSVGIFFNARTTLYGHGDIVNTLTAKGYNGIYSDSLSVETIGMNTDIVIVAEGSNGGLVGVRDRRTRPQLTYYYTRPLNLQSSHITLKCKGGTISGISYWQGIYGHPDLHISSPDPNHTQWNPVQHMICDTQGDGNPIVGEWIVIEGTFEDYGFQVYGKDVTAKNYVDILGDGVFSYSPENKTLIVRQDYQGFGQDAILYNISAEDLTVNILEDVTLTAQTGIISKKNLTIAGSGRLTLSTDNTTIGMSNGATLTLRDITIDAESKNRCMAGENAECFVVDKAVIRAKGPQGAVCDFGAGIILGDYMIALPTGGYVKNGDIVDSNGKLATEVFISLYGDVNGDGQVGIGDIVAITNVMAGIETDPAVVVRADVNADTDVGIGDIVAITNIMSGQ